MYTVSVQSKRSGVSAIRSGYCVSARMDDLGVMRTSLRAVSRPLRRPARRASATLAPIRCRAAWEPASNI